MILPLWRVERILWILWIEWSLLEYTFSLCHRHCFIHLFFSQGLRFQKQILCYTQYSTDLKIDCCILIRFVSQTNQSERQKKKNLRIMSIHIPEHIFKAPFLRKGKWERWERSGDDSISSSLNNNCFMRKKNLNNLFIF